MCCLWTTDEEAEEPKLKQGDFIVVINAKASDFGGKSINVSDESKLFVNPQYHKEYFAFSKFYKENFVEADNFHPLSGTLNVEAF